MAESREPTKNFDDLVEIVRILRRECPWDRKQTHQSIKDNLIEEAYEVVEAIDTEDFDELKNELGDVLLHVVFHSNMADETDRFAIDEVVYAIQDKLIRRHPHVFGDEEVGDDEQVAENWETIKKEKEGKESILDCIPQQLPALIRAQRMQEKAANVGFDWPQSEQVWNKLEEELQELKEAIEEQNPQKSSEEFGDLLFSLVNFGRFYDLDAEDSLRSTNRKFTERFQYIEQQLDQQQQSMNETSLEEMDAYWNEAKNRFLKD
jgi:XTP/dITP diphosphohydrolase